MPILSDGIACSRLMRAAVYLSYSNLPADADASCCCSSPRWFSRCQRHKKKSVPLSHRRSEEDEDEVPLELHSGNRSVPEITI